MNLFIPMFITGLLTSFHCVMMCGNMVLSYAIKDADEGTMLSRLIPNFAYQGAKIISYTTVGLVLGSLGLFIGDGARSWVSVVAGGYMVLLGLGMTGKFPALMHLTPRPPRFFVAALSKLRRRGKNEQAQEGRDLATPIGFGLITGLMPCGPLIAAQVAAAGSGSPISGGLMMLGFGLGTAPLMLGYGVFASYIGSRFKRYMSVAAAIMIIVLGISMMDRGATALGSPVNFNVAKRAVLGVDAVEVDESAFSKGDDGVVEVTLAIEGYTFTPSTLAIPENTPVRILVDRKDNNLCSDELWIPALGVKVPLTPNGITTIDLPATEAGTYQMTCQMGMLSATLQVGSSSAEQLPVVLLGVAALAAGAGAVTAFEIRRRRVRAAAESARRRSHSNRPRPRSAHQKNRRKNTNQRNR